MRSLAVALTSLGVGAAVVIACSSESNHSVRCSEGAPWSATNEPPSGAPTSAKLRECVPRCGAEALYVSHNGASIRAVEALPSGACEFEEDRCAMSASYATTCADGRTVGCAPTGFECVCEKETWRCTTTIRSASACSCTAADAAAPNTAGP